MTLRTGFRMVWIWTVTVMLVVASAATGAAQDSASTRVITAIGFGTIAGDDVSGGKDQAITHALVSALARGAADLLPLEVRVKSFRTLNDTIYGQPMDFVSDYKVLTGYQSGKQYRVMVQATVLVDRMTERFQQIGITLDRTGLPTVLLLISEKHLSDYYPRYWWGGEDAASGIQAAGAVAEILRQKGFSVIEPEAGGHMASIQALGLGPELNIREAQSIGGQLNADIVVLGNASAVVAPNTMGEEIQTFKGLISAQAYPIDTADAIAGTDQAAVTVGSDPEAACLNALGRAGSLAGEELAGQLVSAWKQVATAPNRVTIVVEGTRNLANFVAFRRGLHKISGVNGVQIQEMSSENASLIVEFAGNAEALAEKLVVSSFDTFALNVYDVTSDGLTVSLEPR